MRGSTEVEDVGNQAVDCQEEAVNHPLMEVKEVLCEVGTYCQ